MNLKTVLTSGADNYDKIIYKNTLTFCRKHPVRLHSNPFVAGRGSQRFGSFAVPVRAVPVRPVRTV